ncbi:M20/M25/M40 family metallo-hydrolase [Chloroflexi bacterium]|nr:M20/M25/M40 family metallo-hydrolase [Chloroflexota bacterium]
MINRERLTKTFCDLVSIDSPSGEEDKVRDFIEEKLSAMQFQINIDNYGNLIATTNESSNNNIILSAHMDTVEPGRGIIPVVDKDTIYSKEDTILGGDCKAGLTGILEALDSLHENNHELKNLTLIFTREEEVALLGARHLDFSQILGEKAIIFDGEGPPSIITNSSPTYVSFDIEITGRAAHAGVEPEKGISAIKIATTLINKLPQGRLDDETTFNIGKIEGGSVRNAVPANLYIEGEFRTSSIETMDNLNQTLSIAVEETQNEFEESKINLKSEILFEKYSLDNENSALKIVVQSLDNLGLSPTLKGSGGGTDGNIFLKNSIESVVIGMGVKGMHTINETVSIPDLIDCASLCENIIQLNT